MLQGGHGLHRRRGRARASARRARRRSSCRSRSPARGSPARATRCVGGGEVTSGTHVARASGSASAWPTCRPSGPSRARRSRSTSAARPAPPRCAAKPLYSKETLNVADASYPDDLKYHAEHDWARIDGDTADVRHHLVRAGPARRGRVLRPARGRQDGHQGRALRRGRVGEGGLRRRSRRCRARSSRSTRRSRDAPEKINEDPYGDGWLVKVRLTEPSEVDDLLDADDLRGQPGLSRYTSATDADRAAMLERIGAASVDELFADIPEGVRLDRPLDLPPGKPEQEVYALPARAGGAQRLDRGRDVVPRRRDVRPLRARRWSTRCSRARSS